MRSLLEVQKKLLPDLLSVMQKRYDILRYIRFMQPVGRRSLSSSLNLTERVLRSEVEFLKVQNLLEFHTSGMKLSNEGEEVLEKLERVMREVSGIDNVERKLAQHLNVKEAIIISGDSDQSPWVKNELGRACALRMKDEISGQNIIAVTGGSTMAAIADMLTPKPGTHEILFVPARGGLGENVQNQANTIAAKMAEKMDAQYKLLYIPDQVSHEAYQSFMNEPSIKEVMNLIESADIVLHGIGDAITMANRRNTSEDTLTKLEAEKVVGEAFGYYFNENGDVVHRVQTVGIQLDDLLQSKHIFAVAGGASKAKAIRSYMKSAPANTVLITDEAAAIEILKG
ncbi:sugar-binding transcriptional regulator [Peribacillus alkalitolerans]|uniref:sugar-binding transcriptional regulator n=1 Tax=Peribacillus alkalitolerans TaxID=1550385 RepID=UPI0013D7DADD|nr:sugar-binding domain-containing protein [Peribacillus alkalitolerans]